MEQLTLWTSDELEKIEEAEDVERVEECGD